MWNEMGRDWDEKDEYADGRDEYADWMRRLHYPVAQHQLWSLSGRCRADGVPSIAIGNRHVIAVLSPPCPGSMLVFPALFYLFPSFPSYPALFFLHPILPFCAVFALDAYH